jgi:hypothetical protein
LIFNPENGQCGYPKFVKREGCSSNDVFKSTCPKDPSNPNPHPLYAEPTDCQYYFLCVEKKDARRNGCEAGKVFNGKTSLCDQQENLEINDPCRGHYNETYLDDLKNKGGGRSTLAAGLRKTGTGIRLDTKNRERVPVVRKKKPVPQPEIQSPPSVQQPKRKRVRVRVRNPNLPGFSSRQKPVEAAGPPGPPQLALSDDE